MIKKFAIATVIAAFLPACAGGYATRSYEPVVDTYNSPGKSPEMYAGELNLCQQLAASRPQERDALAGVGVGGVVGAAGGALTGAVRGRKVGAASLYGLAGGALLGGATSLYQANQNRQNVVIDCMRGRGWTILGR